LNILFKSDFVLNFFEVLIWLVFLLFIAVYAFKREMLDEGGVMAAIFVGLVLLFVPQKPDGWVWLLVLLFFFIIGSFASKFKRELKKKVEENFAKGGARNLMQVIANSAGGLVFAIAGFFSSSPLPFVGFVLSVSAMAGDTLSSELGVLSKEDPVSIKNFKRIEKGVSGGVTVLGLSAGLLGGLLMGVFSALFLLAVGQQIPGGYVFLVFASLAGFFGSVVDSVLGVFFQSLYYCPKCKVFTESEVHKCGTETKLFKGLKWMDNDVVNMLSGLIIGVAGVLIFYFLVF
jgi:uncharacterized protein (TIGR00297 family)